MTEEETSPEEQSEEETETPPTPSRPQRPPQVVEIKTPLDRPEFSWFLDRFMERMHITDKTQAAVTLTNMFYDLGLDPYADLKELQDAMQQMNAMLQNLPNTPASMQVKDTMSAMYSAKVGRSMLERLPKTTGQDPMMDRVEKMMDKYLPVIMTMQMMSNMMNPGAQQQQKGNNKEKAEIPEELKTEIAALKAANAETLSLLRQQAADRDKKEFAQDIISTVHAGITPQIEAIRVQVEGLISAINTKAAEPAPQVQPQQSAELKEISAQMKEAMDKLGEKAGAKNLSMDDFNTFLATMEGIEKRLKKEPLGEFDWKAAGVSTIGEIGKEVVKVFGDIQASRQPAFAASPTQAPTGASEMQSVIKRQVQNYVLQKLNQGATQMNMTEAAKELGLSLEQVNWAYQILVTEGWIKPGPPGSPAAAAPPAQPQQQATTQPPGGIPTAPGRASEQQPFIET